MVELKLVKMGNGEKTHVGYEVRNDNGTVHHIGTLCNTYPGRTLARLVGEITNIEQITCPLCRKRMVRTQANR